MGHSRARVLGVNSTPRYALVLGLLVSTLGCEGPIEPPSFVAGDAPAPTDDDDSSDSGELERDDDQDGYPTPQDCDDSDDRVWPGAPELCDDIDNDCDGEIDEEPLANVAWYPDTDSDGFGTEEGVLTGCEPLKGYSLTPRDCDDSNPEIHPGALIDGHDADCDGRLEWKVTIVLTVVESYFLCIDGADNIMGSDTLWEQAETWVP